ncbi:MAG: YbaB/EbfC family nucleoid-associated protein [Bacteroidetes bacterium]|nr:YbaB/EbfC family nucleoid-associated protein [Bacteroidota bacterium]
MLDDLMNQMKNMVAASKEKMDSMRIESEKGGIRVACNGSHKILDLHIPERLLNAEGKEELEDLLMAALNEALSKADEQSGSAMKGMTDGIIPGGLDGLF